MLESACNVQDDGRDQQLAPQTVDDVASLVHPRDLADGRDCKQAQYVNTAARSQRLSASRVHCEAP